MGLTVFSTRAKAEVTPIRSGHQLPSGAKKHGFRRTLAKGNEIPVTFQRTEARISLNPDELRRVDFPVVANLKGDCLNRIGDALSRISGDLCAHDCDSAVLEKKAFNMADAVAAIASVL